MLNDDLIAMVEKLAVDHQPEHHSSGNGYTEPREEWVNCSCGIHVWDWQQFYNERETDPEVEFSQHFGYFVAYEAAKLALTQVADEIQALHPGETKASVELLREHAARVGPEEI